MTVTVKARKTVYERDGFKCCACGSVFELTLQHRKNKGMGGSKLLDGVENLLTMCHGCNTALESDARYAETGRRNGWKLTTGEPFDKPVYFAWAREWRVINPEGGFALAEI